MKIVVLDGYAVNPGDLSWEKLAQLGNLKVYDRTREEEVLDRINGAEVVFTNKTPITREVLQESKKLKYVGVLATGYNVVDIETAKELNIIVTNIPAYSTSSVAQMATALLLELCNHVGLHSDDVRRGKWSANPDFTFWNSPLIELDGQTLGIIGFGEIGQRFANIGTALGMKVLAYNGPRIKGKETNMIKHASLEDVLRKSDVISLHCPLFESTKGIINNETISLMKDGVMIINTSRGGLIIEEDLAYALNSGKVAGAGLDVLTEEPPEKDNPLIKAKNCIITPHIAWAPTKARQRLMDIAVDNLDKFKKGKIQNLVWPS